MATGAYGVSFGALGVAAGLSVAQTCALSVLMFTGGSQFALVGVLGGGGSRLSGARPRCCSAPATGCTARGWPALLRVRGVRRLVGAQLVIDESTAVALGGEGRACGPARLGFWATGLAVFVLWNLATLVGAVAGSAVGDPRDFGLDAAAPAAFLALLAPRLRGPGRPGDRGGRRLVALAWCPWCPPASRCWSPRWCPAVAVLGPRRAA